MVLMPVVTACKKKDEGGSEAAQPPKEPEGTPPPQDPEVTKKMPPAKPDEPPTAKPDGWDPIAYNKKRGNAGAIPESYHESINGADGDKKHLGKHLPYQPKVEAKMVPEGFVAIMWGDPDKGYAKHPNAKKGPANKGEGHWYAESNMCHCNWGYSLDTKEAIAEFLKKIQPEDIAVLVQSNLGIEASEYASMIDSIDLTPADRASA